MTTGGDEHVGSTDAERGGGEAQAARLAASFDARVLHKRTYGNKLVFLDLQAPKGWIPPHVPINAEPTAGGASHSRSDRQHGLEVVFSFEVYGAEVRTIRKDISVGDRVHFDGTFRPCGWVLDATSYSMLERWSEATNGLQFDAALFGGNERVNEVAVPNAVVPRLRPKSKAQFCKFWMSNGTCRRADCGCEHPEGEMLKTARSDYWEAQKQKRVEATDPDDPHRSENKRSHAQRAGVFAEWLCSTFGLDALQREGVVDVAGGKGELAFELAAKRQIPCRVVDPRCPGAVPTAQQQEAEASQTPGVEAPARWKGFRLSRQQRQWLEANVPGLHGFEACQAYVETSCPLLQCSAFVPNEDGDSSAEVGPLEAGNANVRDSWAHVVGDCGLIVGLHPDQATGGVLELAREFGKPFAVVPCCTFADDFSSRQLADGRPVRTYADLVAWLQARRSGSQVGYLGFQGKNLVVFAKSERAEVGSD